MPFTTQPQPSPAEQQHAHHSIYHSLCILHIYGPCSSHSNLHKPATSACDKVVTIVADRWCSVSLLQCLGAVTLLVERVTMIVTARDACGCAFVSTKPARHGQRQTGMCLMRCNLDDAHLSMIWNDAHQKRTMSCCLDLPSCLCCPDGIGCM